MTDIRCTLKAISLRHFPEIKLNMIPEVVDGDKRRYIQSISEEEDNHCGVVESEALDILLKP